MVNASRKIHAPQSVRPTVTSRFGFLPPAGLRQILRRVMKRCLYPARLPCLDRGSSLIHSPPSILRRLPFRVPLRTGFSSRGPFPERRQWSRQYSVGAGPPINRRLLQDYVRMEMKRCPVSGREQGNPEAWVALLEQYLPPSLRRCADDDVSEPQSHATPRTDAAYFAQTIELSNLLLHARDSGKIDLLTYVGFRLNNWPAVQFLINRLLDAADSLKEVSLPLQPLSNYDWDLSSGLSLDELTERTMHSAPKLPQVSNRLQSSDMTSLDAFTERPFADDHSRRFMTEVWQGLGSILAMSHVFQILARLHHSGAISDRVYKYVPPDSYQATHIMSVLSDAAWLVHEAEDSPYLPFKMGVRELGPEIWLEFILWCCVEHGHIEEGVWIIDRLVAKTGDQAWRFQSWKPILEESESVWQTKIDQEETWRLPGHHERPTMLRKRHNPTPFHGLGERTMSAEVASALLDNLPNQVYLGLGFRGMSPSALLRYVSSLKFAIAQSTADDKLLPTSRASNWFVVRVVESGGLKPDADPRTFEDFLRVTPCVVPPWDADLHHVNEDDLARLIGLIEYNIRFYSKKRLCAIVDASKMQRIDDFFSSGVDRPDLALPTLNADELDSMKSFESSMPQLSSITLADLIDLITVSRAFTFGDWLFFSNDVDALAPSILRYATATKNSALCNAVIQSLTQPLSSNTIRALLNFRIAMHQWDSVIMLLDNVTALAGEVIRLEEKTTQQSDSAAPEEQAESLARAKDILLRLLRGEFNEPFRFAQTRFQERALSGLHRVFLSVPGALHDVATAATNTLPYKITPRTAVPYIPATAFHSLLSAVVDTKGSAAGQRFWKEWCLDSKSPTFRRLQEGGIVRMFLNKERNLSKGDPHFDHKYFKQFQKKATIPNPNTVRIIAQAALREYNEHEEAQSQPDPDSPTQSPPSPNPAEEVLNFCIERFETFGVRRREINREVGGLLYRRRRELSKMKRERTKMETTTATTSAAS
ncbi:hypothetical protein BO78DRAFT_461672 [Aspergillus sclerotiicarbonarius CBS 121057]|uniref:Uncharacterized protein n=1 Tax=Aspergillus sclerotiicarbonarius (strain CBS 121057 / IBT 28362) TaxID=1448318 RepID=A0A319E736_ASPSB|nr:hypothetical protein BO78DRAFT_461672 [Aspergillus sclerotiicarbonarius CBS 121057]